MKLRFDFPGLFQTLLAMGFTRGKIASMMDMSTRNLLNLQDRPGSLKMESLLLVTNAAKLDVRQFFVEEKRGRL